VGFGSLLAFFCEWNQICWFSFGFHPGLAGEDESKRVEREKTSGRRKEIDKKNKSRKEKK
jgi:hypothetical protein